MNLLSCELVITAPANGIHTAGTSSKLKAERNSRNGVSATLSVEYMLSSRFSRVGTLLSSEVGSRGQGRYSREGVMRQMHIYPKE